MTHAAYQRIASFSYKPPACTDSWWTRPEVQQSRELFDREIEIRQLAMRSRGVTAYIDRLNEKR